MLISWFGPTPVKTAVSRSAGSPDEEEDGILIAVGWNG